MNNPRIIFFGTPEFAMRVCKALIEHKYNVVAAVSQPDRPTGRKHQIEPTPVHALCNEHAIVCLQPEKLSLAKQEIADLRPDLILTCAYGQFIPTSILEIPTLGCVNIHPSLLPKYRGGAPIQHAVMNGDTETGVCLMQMVKAMDAGVVYACQHVAIGADETFAELNERLIEVSIEMMLEALPKYLAGELPGVPQDENGVVIAPNISREEEQVHFQSETLDQLYNHIRGLIDWPIAYGMLEGSRIKFYKVRKITTDCSAPRGTILGFQDHAMEVACQGGILRVLELQMEGKKRMNADAFANGNGRELIGKVFD
jgi:methionyl-tRNA formyltransferase